MSDLIIDRYNFEPNFPNEIWITSKDSGDEFIITLKKGEDIEIEFNWDHGYGGRGSSQLYIPFEQLRDLINELYDKKSLQKDKLQIQIDLLNEIITNNGGTYIVNKLRDLELELNEL